MHRLIAEFRKQYWSPYVAGALLGVTAILAVLLSHSLLGASGAFETLAGLAGKAVAPRLFDNVYFNYIMPPQIGFSVWLLAGVFLGGLLGAWSSGTLRLRWNDDAQWRAVFGPARWKRFAIAFGGAVVLEYAAGIAGGCTSGLAISGGMLLAPAAFLFIIGLFASGIVTTLVIYRGRY